MDISEIKGIGKKKKELFEGLGIITAEDALDHYPVAYEDRSKITPIEELQPGGTYYISALVRKAVRGYSRGRGGGIVKINVEDRTGKLDLVFFRSSYIASAFTVGEYYNIYGKVTKSGSQLQMIHPASFEKTENAEMQILPIYRTLKGISQKEIRRVIRAAMDSVGEIPETLPAWVFEKRRLADRAFALENIHFPTDRKAYAAAKFRLIYEELFLFQTGMKILTGPAAGRMKGIAYPHDDYINDFAHRLGFTLTGAQKRVLEEIEKDMISDNQMQRLLQGDVGSGKTAVAASIMYKAAMNGCQAALMAPTELLAVQHYNDFKDLFEGTGLRVGFLASSMDRKEKRAMLEGIASGDISIIVGTHALIQKDVEFADLGLVITDEQHRFGVQQRVGLASKGRCPDTLVMTATPIPRSLAAVLYNGMDVSVIDELPVGRKPIITKAVSIKSRASVYRQVGKLLEKGQQAYFVAPLIAESESIDAISAEQLYENLQKQYPQCTVGLVHGGMKQAEKDAAMKAFAAGEIRVLAATVVIEVGINVPSATVMVIENAERFGLAQLHQLRGRVGRGSEQSYCYLLTDDGSQLGMERAGVLASTNDGFEIAEKDLQMRGPGDIMGTRQHGIPQLFIADMLGHSRIYEAAKEDVEDMFLADPELRDPDNALLRNRAAGLFGDRENIGL